MAARTIDLNCDVGEGFGAWPPPPDEQLLPLVSSANVACGFHASDPRLMRRTVRLAKQHGVAVGAHPSFPDLVGFGRRMLAASPEEIEDDVVYQIGALLGFCRAEGIPLVHVKPHGALYNAAAKDPAVARAIVAAVRTVDASLWLTCLAGSALAREGRAAGLRCAEEAFADRGYARDGTLLPRGQPGALLTDPEAIGERVARLATEGVLRAADGTELEIDAATVCIHGDTPGAVEVARAVRARLDRDGIVVRSFSAGARAEGR